MLKELWFWVTLLILNAVGLAGIFWLFNYPNTVLFISGFFATLIQITIDKKVICWKYKKQNATSNGNNEAYN
jgi:hypothetical protein